MWSDRMYYYPVQETFRYHFMDSPRVQGYDPGNVKGIMKRGDPIHDRSASRLSPMDTRRRKNERAELDYQVVPDALMSDAPYGNYMTPEYLQVKLVGGKLQPVYDQPLRLKDEYADRRIHRIDPITLPPQQIDPRTSLDTNYYKDTHPTGMANKRPDSKEVARMNFRALPPIQQNRYKMDLTTVFEPEQWTGNRPPKLARETEYKQNYAQMMEDQRMAEMGYTPQRPPSVTEDEKRDLLRTLPKNVILPTDPIKLTQEQERTACKLTCQDMGAFDPRELRDVYVECSQHDKNLDGYCGIDILDNTLRKHRASLSNTLRIIAAQFVNPRHPGKVNYERVLSFIGSALEMQRKGQLSDNKPKFFEQNGESMQTGSIYKDREVAKLLRMVEQELSKSTYDLDWTKWENRFFEKDRDHRKTLSGPQIKDICYDLSLPLSDSLINQILSLCETNNRDGQYKWESFIDFLRRVRGSNTGLPIPVSKRPLEYAKKLPTPVANWPRTDADVNERKEPNSPRRQDSPRRGEYYREHKPNQYDTSRGKSPQRDMPSSRDQRERHEKVALTDRNTNSPYRPVSYRDTQVGQHRSGSPRGNPRSPLAIRDQTEPTVHSRNNGTGHNDKRHSKNDAQSGGYKPSWQDRDGQRQMASPNRKSSTPSERNGQPGPVSPNGKYRLREPWASHDQPEPYQRDTFNPDRDARSAKDAEINVMFRIDDSNNQGLRPWAEPGRGYNRNDRTLNRINRPKSYAEPQRNTLPKDVTRRLRPLSYKEDYRGVLGDYQSIRPQEKLRLPKIRARSLPPIRYASPMPEHYTNTYREYPSLTSERSRQPYTYGQLYNDLQRHERKQYNASSSGQPYQDRKMFRLKAPYADEYKRDVPYPDTRDDYTDQSLYNQQLYANIYEYELTDEDPFSDRFLRGVRETGDVGYEQQQQYPPPRQYSEDTYRRRDDRRDDRQDSRMMANPQDREDKIRQLSKDLHQLESKYKFTKESIKTNELPWLQRYLKLAEALYNSDIYNSGCLPRGDVIELTRQYNDAFSLNLDVTRANMLAISPENLDKSGNVLLRPFLASLCGDNFKYRS